jgi:DNA phosphorothioation-dependent restriction protein DptH
MAVTPIPGINQLPAPLGAVVFHYSKTEDYKPEFASMTQPNTGADVDLLRQIYGAQAVGLSDILILAPEGKVAQRQKEFPGLPVRSIFFDTSELQLDDWKFLMGVVGGEQMYVRKMEQIFRRLRDNINLTALYSALAGSGLNDTQMDLARTRLHFAEEFIREGQFLRDHIQPGRLIIVDLRDALIEKEQALGLFVVMLKILANTRHQGQGFNKLMVFDEAHKYLGTSFVKEVEEVVREMRHKGTTVLIASQDPLSVPVSIIALSTQIILHKFNSPAWLQHIQKSNIALKDLGAGRLNMLNKGQAYVWSSDATDPDFTTRAVRVEIRPRVTKHGGSTVTAM